MAPSIFSVPEPVPPRNARASSILIGCVGMTVVVLTLIHHASTAGWLAHKTSSPGFSVFVLVVGVFPAWSLIHALRTGTAFCRFGIIDREETPLFFWVYVLLNVTALLCLARLAKSTLFETRTRQRRN
jgi:hypothetical protein